MMRLFKPVIPLMAACALAIVFDVLPATAQNRIIEMRGTVMLKRSGSSGYRRVSIGTELFRGDILQPATGAKVTVRCASLRRWIVPVGIPSTVISGCPEKGGTFIGLRGGGLETIAGGTDSTIPYIISPRRTWLLSEKPLLKWNPVTGVSSYTVSVKGPGVDWHTRVIGTEIIYPGDPPLQPGETYLLVVEADDGRTSQHETAQGVAEGRALPFYEDEKLAGWGFSVLPDVDLKDVTAELKRVTNWEFWELADETKTLAATDIYINHDLYADAIDSLEALVQKKTKVSAVYNLLGNLYSHVGLDLLAEARYQKAIELAKVADDLEAQATARVGLAQIYAVMNKPIAAISLFKQAQTNYRTLGDAQKADDLEPTLAKLANRVQNKSELRSQ